LPGGRGGGRGRGTPADGLHDQANGVFGAGSSRLTQVPRDEAGPTLTVSTWRNRAGGGGGGGGGPPIVLRRAGGDTTGRPGTRHPRGSPWARGLLVAGFAGGNGHNRGATATGVELVNSRDSSAGDPLDGRRRCASSATTWPLRVDPLLAHLNDGHPARSAAPGRLDACTENPRLRFDRPRKPRPANRGIIRDARFRPWPGFFFFVGRGQPTGGTPASQGNRVSAVGVSVARSGSGPARAGAGKTHAGRFRPRRAQSGEHSGHDRHWWTRPWRLPPPPAGFPCRSTRTHSGENVPTDVHADVGNG